MPARGGLDHPDRGRSRTAPRWPPPRTGRSARSAAAPPASARASAARNAIDLAQPLRGRVIGPHRPQERPRGRRSWPATPMPTPRRAPAAPPARPSRDGPGAPTDAANFTSYNPSFDTGHQRQIMRDLVRFVVTLQKRHASVVVRTVEQDLGGVRLAVVGGQRDVRRDLRGVDRRTGCRSARCSWFGSPGSNFDRYVPSTAGVSRLTSVVTNTTWVADRTAAGTCCSAMRDVGQRGRADVRAVGVAEVQQGRLAGGRRPEPVRLAGGVGQRELRPRLGRRQAPAPGTGCRCGRSARRCGRPGFGVAEDEPQPPAAGGSERAGQQPRRTGPSSATPTYWARRRSPRSPARSTSNCPAWAKLSCRFTLWPAFIGPYNFSIITCPLPGDRLRLPCAGTVSPVIVCILPSGMASVCRLVCAPAPEVTDSSWSAVPVGL